MKRSVSVAILLICSLFLLFSCAKHNPPRWVYEPDAITINLRADKQLNLHDEAAHTLSVCVYQLKDPKAFQRFADQQDGLLQLSECGIFDPSVAGTRRVIVHPDQELTMTLDREVGVKYIGIVAGYSGMDKAGSIRFYKIPVVKKGLHRTNVPGKMNITLILGRNKILTPQGR